MKAYQIALKSGVITVREDEVEETIRTLTALRPTPSTRVYAEGDSGYVDCDAALKVLRRRIDGGSEAIIARRVSRLWMTIDRLARNGDIAFDAYCRYCGIRLAEHGVGTQRCMGGPEKSRMVIKPNSLRRHASEFGGDLPPYYRIGPLMQEDYAYLAEHLPTR